ncbi:MAG: hypothetical protein MJ192_05275 [Clostridia bacterium]|nr:hypothetical protein [Clostridia bacterium]
MRAKFTRKGSRTRLWVRLLAGLMGILCAASMLTTAALAADGDEEDDKGVIDTDPVTPGVTCTNTYVLAVSTGYAPGTSIQYFGIRYIDTDGVARTAFVFPHEGTLKNGYEMAAAISEPTERIKNVKDKTDYELTKSYLDQDGLSRNSFDTYLFECYYDIREILFIDVFMTHAVLHETEGGESTKNEWTCNGITVYKAEMVYGMRMAGYYSSNFYLDFDGTALASLDMDGNECYDFSLNRTDVMFRMGDGAGARYDLVRDFGNNAVYRTRDSVKNLLFRIDLADVYGSGIEALVNEYKDKKKSLSTMELNEYLAIGFLYTDTSGTNRMLMMPVITSFLSYAFDMDPGLADEAVVGVAQQGDTLIFEAEIPAFGDIAGYTLYYGSNVAELCDITTVNTVRRSERDDKLQNDQIAFTGLSIYDAETTKVEIYTEEAALRCSVDGTPLLYYKSSTTGGQTVRAENSISMGSSFMTMEPGESGSTTVMPEAETRMYIVQITTDSMVSAGTTDRLYASFTYVSTDGVEKQPSRISLKEVCSDWCGYWPTSTGEDISYLKGVSAGGTMTFALTYPDVRYFKSVELSAESDTGKDDWQISSIAIYDVSSVSTTCARWLDEDLVINDIHTDRELYRSFDTSKRVQYSQRKILLNPDMDSIKIVFDGSGGGSVEEVDVNWDAIKYSMTLNEAMSDLGFTKARREYEVTVKVRSNAAAENDDCGSNNKFYFQLIFETGKSSYMQANQQLLSDGFRAGKAEVFTITVNRDYGDLRAIRIIPDDTIDTENIYDKLNVDYIQVVEKANASVSHSWRVNNVNWIGIDYKDNGGESSQQMRIARLENEICRSYPINAKGYAINFQVAISYGGFSVDSAGNTDHYEGSLLMEIKYLNSENKSVTNTIDVARAMAEYASRSPIESKKTESEKDLSDLATCLIDNSYMMRPGTVDRFLVSLTDVKSIKKVTLYTSPLTSCSFSINSISFYLITSDGALVLNDANEYQRDWKTDFLCSNNDKEPRTIKAIKGHDGDPQFDMQENTINITESWNSVVEREPTGNDDTINMYIFPSDNVSKMSEAKRPTVEAVVKYQAQYMDRPFQIKVRQGDTGGISFSAERNMYYAIGVSTAAMSAFKSLKLEGSSDLHIDHVIVQQVRYGVVVNTYYIDFNGSNVRYATENEPRLGGDGTAEEQLLHLRFTMDTQNVKLSPETTDIAVLIRYTTVNDMNAIVYDSTYIFLTDQNITEFGPGSEVIVKFTDMYVKDIVGISLVGLGEYTATIDSASVWTYQIDAEGNRTCTGQYAAKTSMGVTRSKQTLEMEAAVLTMLDMEFASNPVIGGEIPAPERVGMEIKVTNVNGQPAHVVLDSLAPYLVSGSFAAGDRAVLALTLKDVKSIEGFIIRVYGDDTGLDLSGINVKWSSPSGNAELYQAVNAVIAGGTEMIINPKTVSVWVQPEVYSAGGELLATHDMLTYPDSGEIEIDSGSYVRLPGGIENAVPGYDSCVADVRLLSGTTEALTDDMITEKQGAFEFRPPVQKDGDAVYLIAIAARENSRVSVTLTVTVHPVAQVPAEENETETETEPSV